MIHTLREMLVMPSSDDALSQVRGRFIQAVAIIGIITSLIGIVALIQIRPTVYGLFSTTTYLVINVGVLWLVSRQHVALAGTLIGIIFLVAALIAPSAFLLLALLAVVSTAALANRRFYFLTLLVILLRFAYHLAEAAPTVGAQQVVSEELPIGLVIILVSITTRYFVVSFERAQESVRTSELLRATAEVGQIATTILDLQELFNRSVNLIQERFGFYHVQVFMVRDTMAELVASTGEAGEQLLAREHKLEVGSNSVIGRLTHTGEPVVARDTDSDAVHRHNPLLPNTRAELAVPILDGDTVVGALDLQSTQPDAFQEEDVQALQAMANLLSSAIRNARLFEAQEKAAQEQQRVVQQSEANLREIQRLNRQLTRLGWDDYVDQSPTMAGVTLKANQVLPTAEWSKSLIEATRQSKTVVHPANGRPGVVAVPVMLRGEVIGAIEVEAGDEAAQAEAIEMVEAVAQRLATSLDNARLFEEAQASTVQEQRINTIVARFQSATSVDDLLRITLTELSEALGAQHGAIRLGTLPNEDTNGGASQ